MKTPSSSSSSSARPQLHPADTLPPNLSEWLAFGRQLTHGSTPRGAGGLAAATRLPSAPRGDATYQRAAGQPKPSGSASALLRRTAVVLTLLGCLTAPLSADSLWKDDLGPTMLSDKKAIAVGDILTIVVAENTSNSKSTSTKTAKASDIDASISSFLYGPGASGLLTKGGQYPALKLGAKSNFDGGGQIANSETITTRVAVRIVDVLPNRNLVIEGTRHTFSSGEQQDIILRGTVRADDVQANNTVFSYNIADATIKIIGKGAVSDAQKKGWFTKFWDKVTPF